MKGKTDSTAFLHLKSKIGGLVTYIKDRENMCLTADQAMHINKMVDLKSIINVEMTK